MAFLCYYKKLLFQSQTNLEKVLKKNIAQNKSSFAPILLSILVIFFLLCMLSNPTKYISASLSGISAWALNVLPSVLPFMFFTRLLSSLNVVPKFAKPFSKFSSLLFKTPPISIYVFFMAILSGYPVGSKLVADLFVQNKISQEDAFKMSSFCSTSGPMFIIGAVGASMFKSPQIGYVLFISHVLSAITNGICWRNFKLKNNLSSQKYEEDKPTADFSEIVLSSTLAILSVGCIITIFFIIIECFNPLFSLFPPSICAFLQGFVEITKGCISLSLLPNRFIAVSIASFVISFGGISTVLQSINMLSKTKMPIKIFVAQKLMHGIFSCSITLLLLVLI